MRVAADARHTTDPEVEWLQRPQPRLLDERYDERPETAIDVEADVVAVCQVAEGDDVVGIAVGEVYCRPHEL